MNPQQYGITQMALVQIAADLNALDLEGFIEMIDRTDTFGPFIDPTLYMKNLEAGRPLDAMRKIAAAAMAMRGAMPTTCRECGCTNEKACDGGCSWIAPGLCSSCARAAGRIA